MVRVQFALLVDCVVCVSARCISTTAFFAAQVQYFFSCRRRCHADCVRGSRFEVICVVVCGANKRHAFPMYVVVSVLFWRLVKSCIGDAFPSRVLPRLRLVDYSRHAAGICYVATAVCFSTVLTISRSKFVVSEEHVKFLEHAVIQNPACGQGCGPLRCMAMTPFAAFVNDRQHGCSCHR